MSPVGSPSSRTESILIDERFPGSLKAAGEARRQLSSLRSVLEPQRLDELRILVNELVTNSLRHAGTLSSGWIGLRVGASPHAIRVEVTDQGPGFLPELVAPEFEQTSGRGLFLVQALSDRWGVSRNDETTVWAEMDL